MIFIKNALVVIFVILGVVFLLLCLYTFLEEYMAPPKRSYKFKIEYDETAKRFILLQTRQLKRNLALNMMIVILTGKSICPIWQLLLTEDTKLPLHMLYLLTRMILFQISLLSSCL